MDWCVEFVETCTWKILPFVDENGNQFNNCDLGGKHFGLILWCPSDV
jgi:hypothetical protein